jgi:hypothetical protein
MPKATLSFTLPEENEEFKLANTAGDMACALHDISQNIFRPARKHGYPDPEVQALVEKLGDDGTELVSKLEKMFYEVLGDYDITI